MNNKNHRISVIKITGLSLSFFMGAMASFSCAAHEPTYQINFSCEYCQGFTDKTSYGENEIANITIVPDIDTVLPKSYGTDMAVANAVYIDDSYMIHDDGSASFSLKVLNLDVDIYCVATRNEHTVIFSGANCKSYISPSHYYKDKVRFMVEANPGYDLPSDITITTFKYTNAEFVSYIPYNRSKGFLEIEVGKEKGNAQISLPSGAPEANYSLVITGERIVPQIIDNIKYKDTVDVDIYPADDCYFPDTVTAADFSIINGRVNSYSIKTVDSKKVLSVQVNASAGKDIDLEIHCAIANTHKITFQGNNCQGYTTESIYTKGTYATLSISSNVDCSLPNSVTKANVAVTNGAFISYTPNQMLPKRYGELVIQVGSGDVVVTLSNTQKNMHKIICNGEKQNLVSFETENEYVYGEDVTLTISSSDDYALPTDIKKVYALGGIVKTYTVIGPETGKLADRAELTITMQSSDVEIEIEGVVPKAHKLTFNSTNCIKVESTPHYYNDVTDIDIRTVEGYVFPDNVLDNLIIQGGEIISFTADSYTPRSRGKLRVRIGTSDVTISFVSGTVVEKKNKINFHIVGGFGTGPKQIIATDTFNESAIEGAVIPIHVFEDDHGVKPYRIQTAEEIEANIGNTGDAKIVSYTPSGDGYDIGVKVGSKDVSDLYIKFQKPWYDYSDWYDYCSDGEPGVAARDSDIGKKVEIGFNSRTHRIRLIDVNHDIIADSSTGEASTAHCTFEFENVISDAAGQSMVPLDWNDNAFPPNKGFDSSSNVDYIHSPLRNALEGESNDVVWYEKGATTKSATYKTSVIKMIPNELREKIKNVRKSVTIADMKKTTEYSADINYYTTTYDTRMFLLSWDEISATRPKSSFWTSDSDWLEEGTIYSYYFKNDNNGARVKYAVSNEDKQCYYNDDTFTSYPTVTINSELKSKAYSLAGRAGVSTVLPFTSNCYYTLRSQCANEVFAKTGLFACAVVDNNGKSIESDFTARVLYPVAPAFCI